MWPLFIIVDPPVFNDPLCLVEAGEPAQVQAFLPEAPVEAFDISVLGWLPMSPLPPVADVLIKCTNVGFPPIRYKILHCRNRNNGLEAPIDSKLCDMIFNVSNTLMVRSGGAVWRKRYDYSQPSSCYSTA